MNLAKQFREFGVRNSINPMSRDVQTLYYNLVQLFNMAFWQPRLQVETKTLEHLCAMGRKQIDLARNTLIQKGFIRYYKRAGSASPDYELIKLYEDLVFPGETQTETLNGSQMGVQTAHKRNTTQITPYIDKTIKTKQNKTVVKPLLFVDSVFFDYDIFAAALTDWPPEKIRHYYEAALSWSDEKNERKKNWIRAVKRWDQDNPFESRIKLTSNGTKNEPTKPAYSLPNGYK